MFARSPLLTLQQGHSGTFFDWLKDLGLEAFIKKYPLRTLSEWGWLVPQFRFVFSEQFFLDWEEFPYTTETLKPEHNDEALLWDSTWFIESEEEPLWFLHPFFHPNDSAGKTLREKGVPASSISVPPPFDHPGEREVFPYVDYFYHWQGYALVDVIRRADCIAPILNTPDVVERAHGTVRVAEHVRQWDPSSVLTDQRWAGLATPMTWLSHYRSFVSAADSSMSRGSERFARRRRGARALAAHLGITVESLSLAIKERVLVLAEEWRWEIERGEKNWTKRPFEKLRLDILSAVEWLCYLGDRSFEDYLKEWQYEHRGRDSWSQLKDVLPFEWFQNREKFVLLVPHYLKTYNETVAEAERLVDKALENRVDDLRASNAPFGSFLSAFRSMHDQLSAKWDKETVFDFRELRPLDGYLLLAIRVEAILRYALEHGTGLPSKHSLTAYMETLADKRGMSANAIATFNKLHPKLGQLHSTPPDGPIKPIMALNTGLDAKEDYLVKSFLCALVARNYFAHHYYFDSTLWRSEESSYLLSGILSTVLWLTPKSRDD